MNRLFLIAGILVFILSFSVSYLFFSDTQLDQEEFTKEEIAYIEKVFAEGVARDAGKLTIEEQLEELRRIEIKLYGKQISNFDTIRDKIING